MAPEAQRIWPRRARWRLRGALQWPAFALMTFTDAALLHWLPPLRGGVDFVPGLIVASFANLFLVGAIAPWIAGRLVARERASAARPPYEVVLDRTAVALLVAGGIGLVAAGLGSRPLIVAETDRTERLALAVRDYVAEHGTAEARRNVDTANTRALDEDGFFRTCVALDDRTRAYCMFVDTKTDPPTITPDRDARPNAVYFGQD